MITTRHIGNTYGSASSRIELIIEFEGNKSVIEVTNSKGHVEDWLINSLRDIADEFELQNQRIIDVD